VTILQRFTRIGKGLSVAPRPCGQKYDLSAKTLTPTSPHNGSDDGQKRATGDGSYHLAKDGEEIKASQGWDEG